LSVFDGAALAAPFCFLGHALAAAGAWAGVDAGTQRGPVELALDLDGAEPRPHTRSRIFLGWEVWYTEYIGIHERGLKRGPRFYLGRVFD